MHHAQKCRTDVPKTTGASTWHSQEVDSTLIWTSNPNLCSISLVTSSPPAKASNASRFSAQSFRACRTARSCLADALAARAVKRMRALNFIVEVLFVVVVVVAVAVFKLWARRKLNRAVLLKRRALCAVSRQTRTPIRERTRASPTREPTAIRAMCTQAKASSFAGFQGHLFPCLRAKWKTVNRIARPVIDLISFLYR